MDNDTKPKLQKNNLTFRVTTHREGVDNPPPSKTGDGERAGGQLLLTIVGTFVDGMEVPDQRMRPMELKAHGWTAARLTPAGTAAPLSADEAMFLLTGAAATLAEHFPEGDPRGQLCAAFSQAFYEVFAAVHQLEGGPVQPIVFTKDKVH